ncbi:hypothetical protein J6590_085221 [Homalodisca vitripennis]|nr:hypothetical protein J6590_085221 [Homalodisca vitripennis]
MPDHYEKITDGEKGYEIWHCPHCDIGNVNTELQIPKIVCHSPPNFPDRTLEDLKLELSQADILVENETDNAYTLRMAGEIEKRVKIFETSSAEKIEYVNCASRPSLDSLTSVNKMVQRFPPFTAKRLQNDETYEDFFNNNIQEFLKNKDNQKGLQENNDSSCSPRVAGESSRINVTTYLDKSPIELLVSVNNTEAQTSFLEETYKIREKWKVRTRGQKSRIFRKTPRS